MTTPDAERQRRAKLAREHAKNDLRRARALIGSADALANAAGDLPDVVKTNDLRRALSNYRQKRKEANDGA